MRWLRPTLLGIALLVVFLVNVQPHWDWTQGGAMHTLPIHLDEYVHWGYAQASVQQGTISFGNPFEGQGPQPLDLGAQIQERGFQAYLGVLQSATGIPWPAIFSWGPALVAVFLAAALFVVAERFGAGVEAAFFAAAIPTTLRFLGPSFLVPIALGLALLVAGLFFLAHTRGAPRVVAVALVAAGLWPIHVMAALLFLAISQAYGLAMARRDPSVLWVNGATLLPILAATRYFTSQAHGSDIFVPPALQPDPHLLGVFGVVVTLLAAVGCVALVASGDASRRALGAALGLALLALEAVLVVRHGFGLDPFRLYDRSVLSLFVLASLLAAIGAATLRGLVASWRPLARPAVVAALTVAIVLAQGVVVAQTARAQFHAPVYEAMSPSEYDAYVASSDKLGPPGARAVVDGLGTMAFTDVTGHPATFTYYPAVEHLPQDLVEFFGDGSSDTSYIVAHRATIVVTQRAVENPDLRPVAPGVYVLNDTLAQRVLAKA